jgi:hypothetical protein
MVSRVNSVSSSRVSVWVGFLQLDEYGESVSVHDDVAWDVSNLPEGFLRAVGPSTATVDYELDRYAGVLGVQQVALRGRVAEIRAASQTRLGGLESGGAPILLLAMTGSLYSTKETMLLARQQIRTALATGAQFSEGVTGFIVDVILDHASEKSLVL